jgi:amidophosphoribosyltransferase
MRPDSYLDGVQLDTIRRIHGAALARHCHVPNTVDAVTYIPESARSAAEGFAEELSRIQDRNIPIRTSAIKGRYGTLNGNVRSFINPDSSERKKISRSNYFMMDWVKGLEIVVLDDSAVRGNATEGFALTISKKVGLLKDGGARKIHLIIVFPQIISHCPYGVDIKETDRLIAKEYGGDLKKMAEALGVESLEYLSLETYSKEVDIALGHKKGLCMGCVTGEYPTKVHHANKLIFENEIS